MGKAFRHRHGLRLQFLDKPSLGVQVEPTSNGAKSFRPLKDGAPELVTVGDSANRVELSSYLSHRMFGNGEGVQSDLDDDEVLLLQLCSDSDGPRFECWDLGAICFWMKKEALRAHQFHLAEAEIEGP
ncbi:DUF1963 domain-containing protein [Rhizobium ruizarguesonis]|uniref:DUF1963 domain-containing protein n=1 Tax=Rhizobium ruizarguesonis TaxID=2081791 RepID=UPI0024796E93|nr:DUF1963 domain-containing protein [Rhizobium ruizarguesonis]